MFCHATKRSYNELKGTMRRFFVAGIGSGVGKTVISAILTQAFNADYWKPVQCGHLEQLDSQTVQSLVSNEQTIIHPERFKFSRELSPHAAAKLDGMQIEKEEIVLPKTKNNLVIEGTDGLLVPLNQKNLIIDLVKYFEAETILVSKNYLGSINHTLLSLEALQKREIRVTGVIFNGKPNPATEEIIVNYSGVRVIGRVNEEPILSKEVVLAYASKFHRVLQ